ncbi:hypothetical protein [Priestia megaterium]|uniref:hypothetical protein n=1 Tax=Priestia megaterium TaxID=1404 RepID=UPI001374C8D0|nr:hypothetical protein [Priestia megaterium]
MEYENLNRELQGKSSKEVFKVLQQSGVLNPELTFSEAQDMGLSLEGSRSHDWCVLVCG